jgi:chromosome segregation ATPase
MATSFDPLKAAREEMASLTDVLATMRRRENAAEIAMSQAESELNAVRKLRGYCDTQIKLVQERIHKLQSELSTR